MWPPSSLSKSKPSKKPAELSILPASFWFLAWLTLWPWKWRRHCSSETSVYFHRITRRYIPVINNHLFYFCSDKSSTEFMTTCKALLSVLLILVGCRAVTPLTPLTSQGCAKDVAPVAPPKRKSVRNENRCSAGRCVTNASAILQFEVHVSCKQMRCCARHWSACVMPQFGRSTARIQSPVTSCGIIKVWTPEFAWWTWGNPRKNPSQETRCPAKIRIVHLPNAILERYRHTTVRTDWRCLRTGCRGCVIHCGGSISSNTQCIYQYSSGIKLISWGKVLIQEPRVDQLTYRFCVFSGKCVIILTKVPVTDICPHLQRYFLYYVGVCRPRHSWRG
jgi:hypothetical protein